MSGAQGVGEKVTVLVVDVQNKILFPQLAGGPDLKYQRLFNEDMVAGGGGSVIKPGIVTDWEMSADGKTWIITVGDGIKFHNGELLDVDDVFYSLSTERGDEATRLLDMGCFEPRDTAYLKYTVSLEKGPGPNQITYAQNQAAPNFPFNFSQNNQGVKAMVMPVDYMRTVEANCFAQYEEAPIGAGPFKYVSHILGTEYKFERFDDYYYTQENGYDEDRTIKFEFLDLKVVLEHPTRVAALASGEADLIEANINMLKQIGNVAGSQTVWQDESSHTWFINVDCWEPELWCWTKEARQATQFAVDWKTIVDNLYGRGANLKGWVWVTENAMGYSPELDVSPYDPAKAKELWAQAGLTDGVEIDIWTWEAGDLPFLPKVSELVADYWEDNLGIKANVNVGDQQSIKKAWNNRQLPGSFLLRTNEARFDGTSITRGGYTNPKIAWRILDNPEVEPWKSIADIANRAIADVNIETRAQSFTETYKELREMAHWYGPFSSNIPWGVGPRIKTYEPWILVPYFTAVWTIELK
ncbi:MAG: ABC transporter substrate-binding protein [Dehalococcoidia bacterium]